MTRDEAIALAKTVLDQRPRSYVEAAFKLARYVLQENGFSTIELVVKSPAAPGP